MGVVNMPKRAVSVPIRTSAEYAQIPIRSISEIVAEGKAAIARDGRAAEAQREADQIVSRFAADMHILVGRMVTAAKYATSEGAQNTDKRMIIILEMALTRARAELGR